MTIFPALISRSYEMKSLFSCRELLMYCLERGGDPNLPTTDAAKTIYHVAVVAPTNDEGLLQRYVLVA